MKVCLVTDFAKTGGAATAADRIARIFFENGCKVDRISSDGCSDSPFTEHVLDVSRKLKILSMLSNNSIVSHFMPNLRKKDLIHQLSKKLSLINPDWINLHNFHGANWPMEMAEIASKQSPTSWTLHDCSTFLGSYYPSHCPKASSLKKDELKTFWSGLSKKKTKNALSFIAPSHWMDRAAKQGYWKKHLSSVIPYPIFSEYSPHPNREACKHALGVAQKTITILASAGNLNEPRKGGEILQRIIYDNNFKDIQFLLLGKFISENGSSENVRSLGFIQDDELKRIAYCAADLTLHPAPVDNLPNTVIESIACNTPVLGFNTGGLPDMVIPNKTGWLVDKISFDAISQKLAEIIKLRAFASKELSFSFHTAKLFDPSNVFDRYREHFHLLKAEKP